AKKKILAYLGRAVKSRGRKPNKKSTRKYAAALATTTPASHAARNAGQGPSATQSTLTRNHHNTPAMETSAGSMRSMKLGQPAAGWYSPRRRNKTTNVKALA